LSVEPEDTTMPRNTRSLLYAVARLLGDINAIRRGKFGQRLIRKAMLRKTGASVNRLIK
jgi:hypothetical protein